MEKCSEKLKKRKNNKLKRNQKEIYFFGNT